MLQSLQDDNVISQRTSKFSVTIYKPASTKGNQSNEINSSFPEFGVFFNDTSQK